MKKEDLIGLRTKEVKELLDKKGIRYEEDIKKKLTFKEASGNIIDIKEDESGSLVLYESNRKVLIFIIILASLVVGLTGAFGNGIYESIKDQIIEITGGIGAPELEAEEDWGKERIVKVVKDAKSSKKLAFYEYCVKEEKSKEECKWEKTYTKNVQVGKTGIWEVIFRAVDIEGKRGKEASKVVKVDNNSPEITNLKEIEVKEASIKVKTEAKDNHSGIEKYMYSLDGVSYREGSKEYTFNNLESGKEYRIYVKVIDKVGNESIVSILVRTEETKEEANKPDEVIPGEKEKEKETEEKEWDIPQINLDKVPSVFTVGEVYSLPSYYDFGNDTGEVVCLVDGVEHKDTSTLTVGRHTIKCKATSSHGKVAEVEKEIEIELLEGADEIFDGWLRLNLYYPEGSTDWEWRLDGENGIRTGYNGDNWQPYTGPILVKLEDIENIYIRYKLDGETVIVAPKGKVVVDIEPEKWTLKDGDVTKVKINWDSNAKTKKYRIDGGSWKEYTGEFEVGANSLVEAKATKDEKIYDSEGEYQYTKTLTGTDTAYISMYLEPGATIPTGPGGIPITPTGEEPSDPSSPISPGKPGGVITIPEPGTPSPSVLEGPIISSNPSGSIVEETTITITPQEEAYKIYYKINNGIYQEYKTPFTVRENVIIYAYYISKDSGQTSLTSSYRVNNIKEGNLPYVKISANPEYLGKNIESTEVSISGSDYDTLEYSLDGVVYQPYTSSLTITESKTVYARGTNNYGSKIEYVTITTKKSPVVTKKEELTVLIESDPEESEGLLAYTDVNITYDTRAQNKYYSIDGGTTFQKYTGPIRLTKNATVVGYATSANGAGKASKTIDYLSNGISSPIITSDPKSPTQAYSVIVSISWDKNATVKQYKIGNGSYQDYTEPFEVNNNTTITAYNSNVLGENATSTLTITNVVPEPRFIPIDLGDYYLIKLNYPDVSTEESREYKWKDNGTWKTYDSHGILLIKQEAASKYDLTADGLEITDTLGNKVKIDMQHVYVLDCPASELTGNIFMRWDTVAPKAPQINVSSEDPAKEVEVSITYAKQLVERYYKVVTSSGEDSGWLEYTGPFKVTHNNTTIYATGTDRSEVKSAITNRKITNIDEIAPTIEVKGDLITPKRSIPIQITGTDNLLMYMVKYDKGSHEADYFNEDKEDNGKSIKNGSTITLKENGIYTIYAVDSVGNETIKLIEVKNVDLTAPNITLTVLTSGLTTSAQVAVDYGDSALKQYSIGDNTHYQNYTDTLTISSYDYYTKVNSDGSLTIYVKGTDSAGNEAIVSENIYCLDLDKPNNPVITLNMDYPTLTSEGFKTTNSIEVSFDNRNDIINEISLDDGKTWKTYTRTEKITTETKVMARSKKKQTGFTSSTELAITPLTNALTNAAIDENNETEQTLLAGKSAIFKVENDGQAKKITVRSNGTNGSSVKVYGIDGSLNKTVSITSGSQAIVLSSGTTKVEIIAGSSGLKIQEVRLNGIVQLIEGDSILSIMENNELSEGYYNFKVGSEIYPVHMYVLDGDQIITSNTTYGDSGDVATANSYAENMVIVKINGDYTVNSGVTVGPYSTSYGGPKGFFLYVTGKLTNNGIIDNSHGAKAVGQNVYLWKNTDGSYEYVPAVGGAGGARQTGWQAAGNNGDAGSTVGQTGTNNKRATGGGGSGGSHHATGGAGGAGTSYSGGAGGGGAKDSGTGGAGSSTGGAGGAKAGDADNNGGGVGNPGANSAAAGTGGLLIIYANEYENNGTLRATGKAGPAGGYAAPSGGSSGGGSINIFTNQSTGIDALGINIETRYSTMLGNKNIAGGSSSGTEHGGLGGAGTVNIGRIINGTYKDLKTVIQQDIEAYEASVIRTGDSILGILDNNPDLREGYWVFRVNDGTNDIEYPVHLIDINTEIISESTYYGDSGDVGTANTYAQNMVIVRRKGNLTINSGVTVGPYSTSYGGPKGFFLYVTGKLTNNGIIDNSHGAKAVGQNVYLWKNTDGSYEYVPAVGGAGGARQTGWQAAGNNGAAGSTVGQTGTNNKRATGGGGSGGSHHATGGAGGAGTAYSGGAGGGGAKDSGTGGTGSSTGGAGGAKAGDANNNGGGVGNPGANSAATGTGGLLIIYANEYENNGTLRATGKAGPAGGYAAPSGGSSGGGSINIFYGTKTVNGTVNVAGGSSSGTEHGGLGGAGTVTYMQIAMSNPANDNLLLTSLRMAKNVTPSNMLIDLLVDKVENPKIIVTDKEDSKLVTMDIETEYRKEYSLDLGTTWLEYKEPFEVTENITILTRVVDNDNKVLSSSTYTITSIEEIKEEIEQQEESETKEKEVEEESTSVLPSETTKEEIEEPVTEEEKPKEIEGDANE